MKTILIVDDEYALVWSLGRWLEEDGYTVLSALHGRAALDLMAERRPDLIVTDIIMPVMSGRELIQALGGQDATRGIPVLVVTVVSRDGLLLRDLPIAGYLRKPFSYAAFETAVRALTAPTRAPP